MLNPPDVSALLKRNLDAIEARIEAACIRAGRSRAEITLVAVTKYVEVPTVRLLQQASVNTFGESRPQALWDKAPQIPDAHWHLIGHLQRNKVAKSLPLVDMIHSVDSERLLQTINVEAEKLDKVQDVLLEIHLSGESAKQGFSLEEGPMIPQMVHGLGHVRVGGLMCMAALDSTSDQAGRTFAQLRALRDQWQPRFSPPHTLHHLSMGMTGDFEAAIAEGATILRIGSALFEGIL